MTITLRIPVVVCRDGSYYALGHGSAGGVADGVDKGSMYDGFDPALSDADLQEILVKAEVDLDTVFTDVAIAGQVSTEAAVEDEENGKQKP